MRAQPLASNIQNAMVRTIAKKTKVIIISTNVYPRIMLFPPNLKGKGSPPSGSPHICMVSLHPTIPLHYSTKPHAYHTIPLLYHASPYSTDTLVHVTSAYYYHAQLSSTPPTQHISGQDMSRRRLTTPILNVTEGYSTLLLPNSTGRNPDYAPVYPTTRLPYSALLDFALRGLALPKLGIT